MSSVVRTSIQAATFYIALAALVAKAAPFVAVDPARSEQPPIVLQFDRDAKTGFDWSELTKPRSAANLPEVALRDAVLFLQEGIRRMTGTTPAIESKHELTRGILLVLAKHLPKPLQGDAKIQQALRNDGSDGYNDREAFYLRSESDRLLVVANTIDGLVAAVPALLETVGYEVLGMGPNWIHVPTDRRRLVFDVDVADRPSFYLRQLTATTGQSYGVGTIMTGPKQSLSDPNDESVADSYRRWSIGIRNLGRSMAQFPGHAMYVYHRPVVEEMLRTGTTDGFLTPANHLGKDADRPAAAESNLSHLWINTDAKGDAGHGKVYLSDGKQWTEQKLVGMSVNVDVSTPLVRNIVLEAMKKKAATHFNDFPDDAFVFGTESEDGAGYGNIGAWMRPQNRNWYPDYLKQRSIAWPRPYVLHGYQGIEQPQERWDYAFPADVVFGFNNWLLSEFDRWIDSLPEAERVTASGKSKKELVRCSLYSYALHDVPPHLNLDPRIRVMIAGYPKHRGLGEWKNFATQHDMAAAFKRMLPREPSGEYRIISLSYYADHSLDGIPPRWSASPARIVKDLHGTFEAGVRALTHETDFNFGKYGLAYYLLSKVLWNARLSADDLDAIRDRWLQRAYGSGWREMKTYYDFMLLDNYSANAPGTWAKAIRLIDAADAKIDPAAEPDCQRRLDDLKQFWYFYYLLDSDRMKVDNAEFVEFLWKGQMSYMTAMHMAVHRSFGWTNTRLETILPESLRRGPAHYSPEETAAWWQRMLEHWPLVEVSTFTDATLANGRRGRDVDLNDLVRVADFQALTTGRPFLYNSAQEDPTKFLTVAKAGDPIGFTFSWPVNDAVLRFYGPKDVPYGVEYWDAKEKSWTSVVDLTITTAASKRLTEMHDGKPRHEVEVRLPAARTGTYRIEVGRGGFLALLSGLGYDTAKGTYTSRPAVTFDSRLVGISQDPAYFYIPKGTKSLDLENWNQTNRRKVQLYALAYKVTDQQTLAHFTPTREIEIGQRGTHRVKLEDHEQGTIAKISGNGFAFPLLYSVPIYWAKSPAELLIPRAIAEADGLKIVE